MNINFLTNSQVFKSELSFNSNVSCENTSIVEQCKTPQLNISFPGKDKLLEAIDKSTEKIVNKDTNIEYSIHEKTKQPILRILDKGTKEIIKEIPSEKILDMISSMVERTGIFMDKKG